VKIQVDGRENELEATSVNEFKYGTNPAGHRTAGYTLEVPVAEAVAAFASYYRDYFDDAVKFPDDTDELARRIVELARPGLGDLARDEERVFCAFVRAVDFDCLLALFRRAEPARLRYFLNSVTSVAVKADHLVLSGEALDVRPPPGCSAPPTRR